MRSRSATRAGRRQERRRTRTARREGSAVRSGSLYCEQIRSEERAANEHEVDEHLEQPARLEHERSPQRRLWTLGAAAGTLLEIAQKADELDEQDECHEHSDRGQATVVEDVVRERGCADGRRHDGKQKHSFRLGEPVVHEAV